MKGKHKLILVLVVCLAVVISGCTSYLPLAPSTESNQPASEPAPVQHEDVIATLNNYRLPGGYYEYWVKRIQAGRQVCISWEADGALSVYILTETQYDYFKVWGFTARYVAYDKARSGTLCRKVANTDTYYLVIKNSSLFETFKIYSAEAKVTWWS